MTTQRWLGLAMVVVLWLGAPRHAAATLTQAPDPQDFGGVFLGVATNQPGMLTTSLTMNESYASVAKVGVNCPQFSMVPTSGTVPFGGSFPITVTFDPATRGAKSCQFQLKNTAGTTVGSFMATGTGLDRVITLAATTTFSPVRVANALTLTDTRTLVIGNTGNTSLDVTDIAIGGDFTIPNPPVFPFTIGPNGTVGVDVIFDPSSPGTQTASFIVSSNDQEAATITSALSGVGTNARIGVSDVMFGVITNGTTTPRPLAVSNTAAAPLGILKVTNAMIVGGSWFTFGANGANCQGTTTCNFAAGGLSIMTMANVDVTCAPSPSTATGTQTATVTFVSDSDPGGVTVANLTCTAGRSDVMVSPTTLSFADTRLGTTSAPQIFMINNTGTLAANYTVTETGADPAQFNITGCSLSGSIPAASGVTCTVTFQPASLGVKTIGISVITTDPDPGDGMQLITVSGTGVAPQIAVPASLDFGNVDLGSSSSTQTLTAMNTGGAALAISSATFTPASSQFIVMTGTTGAQSIQPGGMAQWTFTCSPATQGSFTATFQILSDSLSGGTTNVLFTCNGRRGVLVIDPVSVNFGAVVQNMQQSRTVTLRNTGNLPVTGITAMLSSTTVGYSIDPSTPVPTTLTAGAMASLTINFLPLSGTDGGPETITFAGSWTGSAAHTTMAVLAVDGDGLSSDVTVSPATLDFGSFRWNTTQVKTFCIVNGSQFSVQIMAIAVNPISPTVAGEFVLGPMRLQATCGVGGTIVTGQPTLASQQVLEVRVTATPAGRIGPMPADIMITTNLLTNPTRHVALTGVSTSGELAVSSMDVDLGAVDVDAGPISQVVTLTNTGDAAFDLGPFTASVDPTLTMTLPATTSLDPNASVTITVTYDPATVGPNMATVTFAMANIVNGPTAGAIMIHGRGIDRSFDAAPVAIAFPDTFRNPGSMAPTRLVTVTNTGEAVLHVSGVMVTDSAGLASTVFSLIGSGGSVDIPGLTSHVFTVAFAPTMTGAAPDGKLVLMSDDDGEPMAEIPLSGIGISRNVAINPTLALDVGYVAVGGEVTVEGKLEIINVDSITPFTIRVIDVVDTEQFTIVNATNVPLDPTQVRSFDVTFSPTVEGDTDTLAYVYLDEDPEAHAMVTLRGHAVAVAVHGGGCATGPTGGAGAALLCVLFLVLRRGRARTAITGGGLRAGPSDGSPVGCASAPPERWITGGVRPSDETPVGWASAPARVGGVES